MAADTQESPSRLSFRYQLIQHQSGGFAVRDLVMKHTTAKIEVDVLRIGHVALTLFTPEQRDIFQEEMIELARDSARPWNHIPADEFMEWASHGRKLKDTEFETKLDRLVLVANRHHLDSIIFDD